MHIIKWTLPSCPVSTSNIHFHSLLKGRRRAFAFGKLPFLSSLTTSHPSPDIHTAIKSGNVETPLCGQSSCLFHPFSCKDAKKVLRGMEFNEYYEESYLLLLIFHSPDLKTCFSPVKSSHFRDFRSMLGWLSLRADFEKIGLQHTSTITLQRAGMGK